LVEEYKENGVPYGIMREEVEDNGKGKTLD
jgi:hypothetical protein